MSKFKIVLVSVLALAAVSAHADVKIGLVDMQQALQSVDAGKKAKAQLEKEFNSKKKELETEKAAIDKAGAEFKKQSMVMSDDARGKKQAELQERVMKFQELTSRSQSEIQQKEQELTGPILTRIRGIITDLAKQKGYSVILEKNENTVLFSKDSDDLTTDVVTAFNKKSSS
jgi:outer membrane protein